MEFEIKNCNNLDHAKIIVENNKLNIKFAPNGTGKSTIAKAIQYSLGGGGNALSELTPFKWRGGNPENILPEVICVDQVSSVMCFNEDYVNNIAFRPDELVSNSFDIFVKNDSYRRYEQEIEEIIKNIKSIFVNNEGLEGFLLKLKELGSAFKLTRTGISKASTGMKGLAGGNKIKHIPDGLELFSKFIQSDKNVGWIDWQIKGNDFTSLSSNCPFCTSDATEKKEQIEKVGREYNKATIKNLVELIDVIDRLGDYFSEDAKLKLRKITTLKEGPEGEHEAFLVNIKTQIDGFVGKLEKLRTLSGFDFKDGEGERVLEKLSSYTLNLEFFSELNSRKTQETVASINIMINQLIDQAGLLQGKVNILRREIEKVIERHQGEINDFLSYAGYKYKVEISGEDGSLQLKLLHLDYGDHLSGGRQHLSFGERNAFAIVLFMYECLAKKPDLIILDDPISSFDKNKKYAILEMLFRKDAKLCLKGKTVLMLTHDVEPIIDTVKAVARQFGNQTTASFLKYASGNVVEVVIERSDIQTFAEICRQTLESSKDAIIKAVYLRRLFEITDEKSDGYQVLSNLLHKRVRATDARAPRGEDGEWPEIANHNFQIGCADIGNYINGFNYQCLVNRVSDQSVLRVLYYSCDNGYERLQIFRLFDLDVHNSVIQKFINETYHIENEFISQLNPGKFDTIPAYVIEECNRHIARVFSDPQDI